jgi:DNA-binding NarL/FixJ family response regulator
VLAAAVTAKTTSGARRQARSGSDPHAARRPLTQSSSAGLRSIIRRVIDRMARQPAPELANQGKLDELTPREREVLALAARGLSNREIATALTVEQSTIRTHIKRILMKLDLRDRIQIVIFAYENGINIPASERKGTGA